ncbi:MAG: hypothetical protein RML36_10815 [Anaerolineae bacterium]|nr:hypothetical protein [Anaerolineae bacterium]MDW8099959.1 hypothetical protein [Anaerolineae bacterium]
MPERFHLFVSAGPDLELEREVIGRVVAQLPIQLGWEIKRTPPPGEPRPADLTGVMQCDLFVFLMGQDIAAPVGIEWEAARRSGRRVAPLLRKGRRTPAAALFLREVQIEWQVFESAMELEKLVRAALVDVLLERAADFRLTPDEWEALNRIRQAEREGKSRREEQAEVILEPAGAGGGGIILGPRDAGTGGVPIGGDRN